MSDIDADTSLTGSLGEAWQGRVCSSGTKGPCWMCEGVRTRAALEIGAGGAWAGSAGKAINVPDTPFQVPVSI